MAGFIHRIRQEAGFTLAEVMIAGLVMVVAMIPIIGMFDGAINASMSVTNIHASVAVAQTAMEQIKAMPYYVSYTGTDKDVDDHFWGSRSPINSNPAGAGGPDWDHIPEVAFYGYGQMADYQAFRVGVQLAYLTDSTGVAAMGTNWGPKTPGQDQPKDSNDRQLILLLIKVNVHWKVDGVETGLYSTLDTLTSSQAVYNLGIAGITVTGPAGIQGTAPNAAAHSPNLEVNVQIDGWGFDPATVSTWLVRDTNNDVGITITSATNTQILGHVNIATTGTSGHSWYPKDDIGYWSVKVRQKQILTVYLYQGFVVEYPKPVIGSSGTAFYNTLDSSKQALDIKGPFAIHVDGGYFVNQVENPAIRLVQVVGSGSPAIINGANVVVGGSSDKYASTGRTIEATFDPAGQPAGDYKLEIFNTRSGNVIGHVSSLSSAVFQLLTPTPAVSDVTVNATGLHYGYNNQGNPWRLKLTGSNFNMSGSPAVDVTLCSSVVGGQPSGNQATGTLVSVSGYNTIVADFDLSSLPTGFYYGWVKNRSSNLAGWTSTALFEVRNFSAGISDFAPNAGYTFYENYYDIPSTITGTSLNTVTAVKISNGSATYDITSDCSLGGGTSIPVNLNLISCDHATSWKVQAYFADGSYAERAFTISLGKAKILPADNSKPALRIYAERGGTNEWHNETTTVKAYTWQTYWVLVVPVFGYGTFEVKGMGFPMNGNNTHLRVWGSDLDESGNYACSMDRASKVVKITSSQWEMPAFKTGNYNISVNATIGDTTVDSYSSRWQLKS